MVLHEANALQFKVKESISELQVMLVFHGTISKIVGNSVSDVYIGKTNYQFTRADK